MSITSFPRPSSTSTSTCVPRSTPSAISASSPRPPTSRSATDCRRTTFPRSRPSIPAPSHPNGSPWVESQRLPAGLLTYDLADPSTGDQKAVLDLAWPEGIQEGLSQPVAALLNEPAGVIALVSQAGYRCFTSSAKLKAYVQEEILGNGDLT